MRDSSRLTLRDILREIAVGCFQGALIWAALMVAVSLIAAMPAFIGLAVWRLP